MQTKGLIKKVRLDSDERSVAVGLTEKGQTLRKSAEKVPTTMLCNLNVPEKDLGDLRDRLFELTAQLEKFVS
jgi:DNA-binding MarR family transcriptional regulator